MKNSNYYIRKIKPLYSEKVQISQPCYNGEVRPVYIVKTQTHNTVFRFSEETCAFINFKLSQTLSKYGIPVPQTSVHRISGEYCEIYPFIEGMTLHEKIINNQINTEQLYSVFKQLVELSVKISQIPFEWTDKIHLATCNVFLVNCFFELVQPSMFKLCHTDLNAKNIVIDKDNNVAGLLDLDAVRPSHFNTMFARICLCAKQYGLDENKIIEMYPKDYVKSLYKILDTKKQISLYNNFAKAYCKIRHKPMLFNNTLKNKSM